MKFHFALLALAMTTTAFAKEDVTLQAGQTKVIKYAGKLSVQCLGNGVDQANTKLSSSYLVTRGGALDSEDNAYMVPGEYMKNFSPLPTKVTAHCIADENTRRNRVYQQEEQNNQQDYEDFRRLNNQYWECTPGGLTGYTSQRNFSGKSCNMEEARRQAEFKCYQNDRFKQRECASPIQCYVVKMDTSLMCDYIYPAQMPPR